VNSIITITLPIFILIGLGNVLVRSGLFTAEHFRGVSRLLLYVALPALIVRALGGASVSQVLNFGYLAGYCGASLAVFAVGLTIGLWVRRRSLSVAAIRSLGMSNSNSAFVGFPVAYQFLGDAAGLGLALNILIENVVVIPTALAAAELGQGDRASLPRIIGRTMLNLFKTPILASVAVGLVLVFTGVTLPTPLSKTVDMLADIASASSLLVIGASLVGLKLKGLRSTVAIIGFGKLVLHPLATLGAITLMGMTDPTLRAVAIVLAASPTMSSLTIYGQRYGDEGVSSAAVLGTTMASFFTLSTWLWLISHGVVR
jgi:predicted permease